jgi:thiol-disulfide isomerase/thioredoxin
MITPDLLRAKFDAGLEYPKYIQTGSAAHQQSWNAFHARVQLNSTQQSLLAGFTRRLNILTISGTWCGDCVQQVPMLDHIARANPTNIHFRLVDRDLHADLSEQVRICGGLRVPTVLFLNEDFEFMGLAGDKSISRLRAQAARNLGASCPIPGAPVPNDEIAATLQDWIIEVERIHLLLRLSAKLRERHGD